MLNKKQFIIGLIIFSFLIFPFSASAAGNCTGYAWGENIGWINFNPADGGGVAVADAGVTGYVWAENVGWIKLDYDGVAGSNNNSSTDWGVTNDGSGNLAGYAWGENIGWINFNPTPDSRVIITGGSFSGYAWSENIGWIKMDHAQTNDRPVTSTPDIVAVDAGASLSDRTSLTSNTYFKYSDTGSDDQISFSWTDPTSISNDTFYYELNSSSSDTITGDESTTTNPYIDSIAITEGTNYFHVRPRNGATTWGTERTFIVKYDKTSPTNLSISSIVATTSQLTLTAQTAIDLESNLHFTPYQFQETTGHSGATSSDYQESTTYIDTGLASNTQYTYKVRAKDAAGNESDYSSTSSKYTLAPTPTNLTSISSSTTSITLSVDAINNPTSDSSGYYFFNTTNSTNSTWIRTNAWQDTGLSCGTTYSYSVIYKNGDGTETTASTTSVTTTSCPTGGSNPGPVFTNTTTTTPTPPTTTEEQVTQNNLLAQIKELQDKITLLKQQIQTALGDPTSQYVFTRMLKYGDRNQDVVALQSCLKNKYPAIYPEGIISGWFGPY
jgi:hypothetical protein